MSDEPTNPTPDEIQEALDSSKRKWGPMPARRSVTGLLPCPFCGDVNLARLTYRPKKAEPGTHQHDFIQCNGCGATGPSRENEAQTRAAWDTRAFIA